MQASRYTAKGLVTLDVDVHIFDAYYKVSQATGAQSTSLESRYCNDSRLGIYLLQIRRVLLVK